MPNLISRFYKRGLKGPVVVCHCPEGQQKPIRVFSRSIPSDLRHRFNKRKIEVSLRTKSEAKAAKSAAALSDRLERYWDSLRMEMIYSKELGLNMETLNAYYYTAISQEEAAEQRLQSSATGETDVGPTDRPTLFRSHHP